METSVNDLAEQLAASLADLPRAERIEALNGVRRRLHEVSPFADEPVDCVIWVPAERVAANDYNPNSVAPPEMVLLERSIEADGYTQPIVSAAREEGWEVVDGFHRSRVGRESAPIAARLGGYLPITEIRADRDGRSDRIASTIRHNRARGKHAVAAMTDIVVELARRGWTDDRIGGELGMEPDEVLRLKQISGLAEMFGSRDFSEAWEIDEERLHA